MLYNNTYNIFIVGLDFSIRCSDVMEEGWHKTTHMSKCLSKSPAAMQFLQLNAFSDLYAFNCVWVFTEIGTAG